MDLPRDSAAISRNYKRHPRGRQSTPAAGAGSNTDRHSDHVLWAAIQFVSGLFGLLAQERGGVAFWAHIGGFVAGVVLIKLFTRPDDVMAHQSHHWEPRRLVGR